jgi:hypothetical protein
MNSTANRVCFLLSSATRSDPELWEGSAAPLEKSSSELFVELRVSHVGVLTHNLNATIQESAGIPSGVWARRSILDYPKPIFSFDPNGGPTEALL